MTIDSVGGMEWPQYASNVVQKRNTGKESSPFALEESGTDSADISSGDKNLTPQPGAIRYDLHSITNDQMWDLAGKAGLDGLRMFSMTHPPRVSVDGKPNDSSTANRKIDFLQLLASMIAFDNSIGDTKAATQDQSILSMLSAVADKNGVVTTNAQEQIQ